MALKSFVSIRKRSFPEEFLNLLTDGLWRPDGTWLFVDSLVIGIIAVPDSPKEKTGKDSCIDSKVLIFSHGKNRHIKAENIFRGKVP